MARRRGEAALGGVSEHSHRTRSPPGHPDHAVPECRHPHRPGPAARVRLPGRRPVPPARRTRPGRLRSAIILPFPPRPRVITVTRTMPQKVYIETVGCQMNVLDSELVVGALRKQGYVLTDAPADADVLLFNTCSVREHAEEKVYSALGRVRHVKRKNPAAVIGVLGCMAQKDQELIRKRAPYVDMVVGTGQLAQVPALVEKVRETREPQY